MELMVLPILALLGLVFLIDTGGSDDDTSEPDQPNPDLNRQTFGPEDDTTTGTDATDYLFLNDGDDTATGGAGDDSIFFGAGADQTVELNEDGSFDTAGMEGDDLIRGGEGRDILIDALGSNTIYGDTGYDRMNSVDDESDAGTADTMFGGFGNDIMFADNGDVLSGGEQDDRFNIIATDSMNPVTITDFTEGDEILLRDEDGGYQVIERISTEVSENGTDTNVSLDGQIVLVLQGVTEVPEGAIGNPTAPAMYGATETDEDGNIVNDDFDDEIVINDYTSAVFARGGDDTIGFADDAETAGRDMRIFAGDGDDVVTSGLGDDSISGGLGADILLGGGGFDEIDGGYGNDSINTIDTSDTDEVGALLNGDIVDGGAGDDTIIFDAADAVTGGDGVDTFLQTHEASDARFTAINDFDPASESLVIQTTSSSGVLDFAELSDGSGTYVTIDGVPVTYLVGLNAADAAAADITLA